MSTSFILHRKTNSLILFTMQFLLACLPLVFIPSQGMPQNLMNGAPEIGAQVIIEPGQTAQEIDHLFKTLNESGMTITRIRMFEIFMHKADGEWDFSLFDLAFKSAEKYNVKIFATLFPATSFTDVGGFKFPKTDAHLNEVADYIKNAVTHFKQFKSLYGWVLINEPGSGVAPLDEPFTQKMFSSWKEKKTPEIYNSKGYYTLDFDKEKFLVEYNIWYLNWLAAEVHKYQPSAHLHVNNHAIFGNVAEYNFPEWRKFLTTLGGSAHASWHFGYFTRSQYDVAMSANCEIIRSGAGNIPWLMTEIQGGNNTYSGFEAMCPTKEEISQWLWTIIGSGGKGGIFWCLNPRASGFEAGEWNMLNFQDKPSDRLIAAAEVTKTIAKNEPLFANAKPVESGINILYTRQSLWIEKKQKAAGANYEGRMVGGVMKSALGYFEALSEMGLQSNFKAIDEFDFTKTDYKGITIILANQISIPSTNWKDLENFVRYGGKLLVDGLTAYYDENSLCIMKTGFPLETLFGGNIKEFKLVSNLFDFKLDEPNLTIPAHCWRGTIQISGSKPIGTYENEVIATNHLFGKGEVVWTPSLLGLGGRIKGYTPLIAFLNKELHESIVNAPFRFKTAQPGMLLKTLHSGDHFITIVVNKATKVQTVELVGTQKLKPTVLFAEKNGKVIGSTLTISPEETMVIDWK